MAKKKNIISTIPITVSTTPPVEEYLERLVSTGLYGKNTAEAAERLIAKSLEGLLKEGTVLKQMRPR